MEILSVALKNFKSHSDRQFIFQPGTNAICGENGAGKTSILEAIAWVLFDYAGDYTKEDLIRNGAASAQARIAFVSNRDGRTYEVQRCTTKSYTLYDPQLNQRLPYSRIKEEVMPWLRQQFGVSPGTDLSQLFSSTIGVPQGTFTVDFLLTREKRKPIFDKILKVEEYQQTWKNLADLEKYAKNQVEALQQGIARYDEDLQALEGLNQKREQHHQEIGQVKTKLVHLQAQLAELGQEQEKLSALATHQQQLDTQLKQLETQIQTQTKNLERLQEDLDRAAAAATICTARRDAYHAFLQADERSRSLELQWRAEQTLQQQRRHQEKQLGDRQTDLTKLTLQLNRLAAGQQDIERLEPLTQRQVELEQTQQSISQQLQQCLSVRQSIKEQEKRFAQTQTRQTQLSQEIANLHKLKPIIQEIPALEEQQQRYHQQLSRIAAAAQFETELRQLFTQSQEQGDRFLDQVQQTEAALRALQQTVPHWQDTLELALTTLHSGTSWQHQLTTTLQLILDDLAEQTSAAKLERQLQAVQTKLQASRQQHIQFANLERLVAAQADLEQDANELHASLTELRSHLSTQSSLQQTQLQLAEELTALDNPKARIQLWQEELLQQSTLQTQAESVRSSLKEIEAAIAHIDEQLSEFATLAADIQTQQALKEEHREAYETYMRNREVANTRKQKHQQVQEVAQELQTLNQQVTEIAAERDRLRQTFDPARFQDIQTAYQHTNTQTIALSARLPDMLKYLEDLDQQLVRLHTLQTKRTEAQVQLEQKKKTERFIKFARKAYKEAGPRITERYIQSISREADKLFRELLNRPNVSLQWTRDYEITIQERSHTRRFVNLSGGEQMCAALAVRLALLKVLADIDVAFFDEPTTNMDRQRREHLAEAIANIKSFRQLFVISHDDTFEKVTENIILVEREI